MEKTGLMHLSTACITPETAGIIAKAAQSENELNELVAFNKSVYGWFVYVPKNQDDFPKDLKDCMKYAKENDCDWICFDRDVEFNEKDGLPRYEVW